MRQEFSTKTMEAAHERSGGVCECGCGIAFDGRRPDYHHIIEAELGGTNDLSNCLAVLKTCHRRITSDHSMPVIAKVRHVRRKSIGAVRKSSRPIRSRGFQKRVYAEPDT